MEESYRCIHTKVNSGEGVDPAKMLAAMLEPQKTTCLAVYSNVLLLFVLQLLALTVLILVHNNHHRLAQRCLRTKALARHIMHCSGNKDHCGSSDLGLSVLSEEQAQHVNQNLPSHRHYICTGYLQFPGL
jgi:hypothetical protein